jgi:hypothetical protein
LDGEPKPRSPRAGTRRLRDISHLYLSQRASARLDPAPPLRRGLRLAFSSPAGSHAAKIELCANLALQFAQLGRRTLVLDCDTRLPNVGFRLGLPPAAYLSHLDAEPAPHVARAVHGLRIVTGWTAAALADAALAAEVEASGCVLVNLPETPGALQALAPLLATLPVDTTLTRAATRSPMFGAWMATAQRPPTARRAPGTTVVDAALWILDGRDPAPASIPPAEPDTWAAVPLRTIAWGGTASGPGVATWARVPEHPCVAHLPVSSLEPEHPAARLYESLAQSLLAGLGSVGVRRA